MKYARTLVLALAGWAAGAAVAAPTLWIDDASGRLGTVDVATGAVDVIGNTGQTLTDIAFAPNGMLYGITFTGLYSIDKTTAAASFIGNLGTSMNSLVFGSDGTLYGANSRLYTIDLGSGLASSVGNNTGPSFNSAGDLAFVGGNLFLSSSLGQNGNTLMKIDKSTGIASTVGSMGVSDVFGLATDNNVDLYAVAGTRVYTVDTSTGLASLAVNYGGHGLGAANGTSFISEAVPPVPEPSTYVLMAAGLGVIALLKRRRDRRA